MYLIEELLYLSPFILYGCYRALKLSSTAWAKAVLGAAFVILAAAYPAAEAASHGFAAPRVRLFVLAGYCAIPFWLYFVMTTIFSDALIFGLRSLKIVSTAVTRRPAFRRARLAGLLLVPMIIVAAGIVNYRTLRVREYSVSVPRKAAAVDRLNIVFAADLHLSPFAEADFLGRFVDKVNALDPDLVLLGGDILEGDRKGEDTGVYERALRKIKSRLGVYAVAGNHEAHRKDAAGFLARAGIRLLRDEAVTVGGAILLVGRNDAHTGARKPLPELLAAGRNDLPVVVLDHRPVDFKGAARAGAAIQFSGHTHNGQLFPVNFVTKSRYGLSWGYRKVGATHVFVTSGARLWGPPVRTAGFSEILHVSVTLADGS